MQRLQDDIGELWKDCVFLHVSNDGVEVEKGVSYTPVTARLYDLPPSVRGLLRSILLLSYFPPYVKNYRNMCRPVCDQFAKHCPNAENAVPFEVYNAHTSGWCWHRS